MGPLNQHLGGDSLPGPGPTVEMQTNAFQIDEAHGINRGIVVDKESTSVDNVGKEYLLLPGTILVLALAGDAAGKFVDPDHDDAPVYGDVTHAVILNQAVDVRSRAGDGTFAHQSAHGLIHGAVSEAKLFWGGADANYIAAVKAVLNGIIFLP